MWFWIGMLAALVVSFMGWLKVQQTGNQEALDFWSGEGWEEQP